VPYSKTKRSLGLHFWDRASVLCIPALLVAGLALAPVNPAWATAPGTGGASELVRLLLIAFLVLICAATVWFVIRKRHQLATGGATNASKMTIVGVLPVGPREKVVMMQVRHRTLLLGVTAHEVRLLANLTDDDAAGNALQPGEGN
jgi:flagellar protein FliO/FliZ